MRHSRKESIHSVNLPKTQSSASVGYSPSHSPSYPLPQNYVEAIGVRSSQSISSTYFQPARTSQPASHGRTAAVQPTQWAASPATLTTMSPTRTFSPTTTPTTTTGMMSFTPTISPTHHSVVGDERIVSVTTHMDEHRTEIVGERTVEHNIRVPKKIIHEDVIERVLIVPETVRREEVVEEQRTVQERIIEIARPVVQETVIEVPEYVYVEKIVEVPETIVQERIREVPKVEIQERVRRVPKPVIQEKVVEVPEIEYRDVIIEKIVEVPEIREQIVTKEVPVPQFREVLKTEFVDVEEPYDVQRNIPIPVELVSTFEYQIANVVPKITKVEYPVYLPRFVEFPVLQDSLAPAGVVDIAAVSARIGLLSGMKHAVSLCEVENLATMARSAESQLAEMASTEQLRAALKDAWTSGTLKVVDEGANKQTRKMKDAQSKDQQQTDT